VNLDADAFRKRASQCRDVANGTKDLEAQRELVSSPPTSTGKPAKLMVKKPLGRAIRRPNSRCFDLNNTHAEQDQAVFVGHGQIEVRLIPEMLDDISQKLARVFDRSALGVVKGRKIQPLIVLHGESSRQRLRNHGLHAPGRGARVEFRPVNDSWERYSVYSPIA
jgi:hypothetical protein